MAKNVCLFETADMETVRVTLVHSGGVRGDRVWLATDWLSDRSRPGVFSYRGEDVVWANPSPSKFNASIRTYARVHFHISDPDVAVEFKMVWG